MNAATDPGSPCCFRKAAFHAYTAGFPPPKPFGILKRTLSPGLVSHRVSHMSPMAPRSRRQHLVPKQGVKPTLLPTHLLSKPMISSMVGGCGGAPKIVCLTGLMSFHSSKPRVASQHCSPKKMDKAKKDLTNSLGRSPSPPDTNNEASCWDCSPGTSLLLPNNCNQGPKKYSVFRQKTFYADVLVPGASSISGVSAMSSSFSITVLKWEDL